MLALFVAGGLMALSLTMGGVAQAQSSCDAGKTKAAGRKVACKLNVIARAQKTGAPVDTAKLARCETKFASWCTKAQGQGDCTAQIQPCDAIEATADACVDDLDGEVPTTTTTTTMPPTTTTTMPPAPCEATTGGFCWFLGAPGADCDATCAARGRVYDSATDSYAGFSGSDANCQAVVGALLGFVPQFFDNANFSGVGCSTVFLCIEGCVDGFIRDAINPTTSGASFTPFSRACACM